MTSQKTYEVSMAPPSIALALMAWSLAWERKIRDGKTPIWPRPTRRLPVEIGMSPSSEYYQIIDRISRGEAP